MVVPFGSSQENQLPVHTPKMADSEAYNQPRTRIGPPPAAVHGGANAKRSRQPPPSVYVPPGYVAFRLLCHSSRVGGLIGVSGSIIKKLRQETSSKIWIEDAASNSDDYRVIVVVGSSLVCKRIVLRGGRSEGEEGYSNDEWREQVDVSAAQEAVVRVFERVVELAAEAGAEAVGGVISCRLLAEAVLVGSVIGKGGKVIEMIKKESGCRIKVLTSERLPACALSTDEMVEIEGSILGVKKALVAVCQRLQDCVEVDRPRVFGSRPAGLTQQGSRPDLPVDQPPRRTSLSLPPPASLNSHMQGGQPFSAENNLPLVQLRMPQEVIIKILCPNDKVGRVIGKGGSIIRSLQSDTGTSIIIGPVMAGCVERLITITAVEDLESRYSPVQRAVILLFNRIVDLSLEQGEGSNSKGNSVTVRLVVVPHQVGCLLGKGGAIVSEMRKETGTSIWILAGDQVPVCVSGNNEVVEITGEFGSVQNALYKVTDRLRDNILLVKMPNGTGSVGTSSSTVTEISPHAGERDASCPSLHPSVGVSPNLNQHTALTRDMGNLKISSNRPTSPGLSSSQVMPLAYKRNALEVGGPSTSSKGCISLGSGTTTSKVPSSTVEIFIPDNDIGSIYGDTTSNLDCLRQISGANVLVHDADPGTNTRKILISGTSDEVQAAQSLLQAFLVPGTL